MLQRPHFLPKDSPSSVAQTAQCVRIILYVVESRGGSPAMQKHSRGAKKLALLVPYLPLANSMCGAQRPAAIKTGNKP